VERHKVLSEGRNSDGLYEVTIRATVKDRQLYEKLRRFQPASAKVEGSNIFGAVTSRMESRKKAAKLLAKSLAATDLPLPLLKTEFLSKTPKILEENAESILAEWQVRVSFDQKLYQEKVYPWLRELLGDVATDKKLGLRVPWPAGKRRNPNGRQGRREISSYMSTYTYMSAPNTLNNNSNKYYLFGTPSPSRGRTPVPKHWLERDKLIYLWNKGKDGLDTYDLFWVPSEVFVELVKFAPPPTTWPTEKPRKKVSGLVFELKGENQNVLLKKELLFSEPYGGGGAEGFEGFTDNYGTVLSPMLFYPHQNRTAEIIPAFLWFSTNNRFKEITGMKDHIIVPWRIRVPLETINKTKDVNCRIAPSRRIRIAP
jgi:hypothetical protein